MSIETATDLFDRVKASIGEAAKKDERSFPVPNAEDDDRLQALASDAISEIAKKTDRLTTAFQTVTTPGQAYLPRPAHVDVIDEANVFDGGSSYPLDVQNGHETAQLGRQPNPDEDRPNCIGAYDSRIWFYPVPDQEYTIDLYVEMNGEYSDSSPADDEPPLFDDLVGKVPKDLERALVAYTSGEWLRLMGYPEIGQSYLQRFYRDVRSYDTEPIQQSRATVEYNPLSL